MSPADKNVLEPKPRRDERAFLGEEWLTWLWYRVERGDAEFDLGSGRRAGVALDAPLVLRAAREDDEGKRPEQALRFGRPLGSPEAAAALARGKRLARARLIVADGGREWEATFDAETFSLRSARVPTSEEEDLDARGEEHLAAFHELATALDGIYREFLVERLAPSFRKETLPKWREWTREKTRA